MEKEMSSIFYIGIDDERSLQKEPFVYKLTRALPYEGGSLQIYFGLLSLKELPVKSQKKRLGAEKRYRRQEKKLFEKLSALIEKAGSCMQDSGEILLAYDLRMEAFLGGRGLPPMVLFAVGMKQKREMIFLQRKITLSLPEEEGELFTEDVQRLLIPYLKKMNELVICGEESACAQRIEDFVYEEFGILTSYERRPVPNTVWLDLDLQKKDLYGRFAVENGIYHLNREEVLKFLDTVTKNGYNTEVD